ncbi:MAG: ATP-binding protein [Candidatus Omnitrophica bacterium]|nr:ATP-binding protein [Candidatus Omnitrophota bacterium]
MKFRTIKFKVIVLYTAIFASFLLVYNGLLYYSLRVTLYNDLDSELTKKVQETKEVIVNYADVLGGDSKSFLFSCRKLIPLKSEYVVSDKAAEIEKEVLLKKESRLGVYYIALFGPDGKLVRASFNLNETSFPGLYKRAGLLISRNNVRELSFFQKKRVRFIEKIFYYKDQGPFVIVVGSSIKPIIGVLENRVRFLILSIPFVLFSVGLIGAVIVKQILRPVIDVASVAKSISEENLSGRVKTEHIDEEMQYLSNAFNDMIERLEKSFKHIAEFSSQVAHELKTPLAIMRGESELALSRDRTDQEYKKVIETNLDEIHRMLKTIEDLLLLTRLEYRPEVFKFEQVNLSEFLNEVYQQVKLLALKKSIKVEAEIPKKEVFVRADRIHLRRLFFNLVHNAVKFNYQNGRIFLSAEYSADKAYVSIADTGVGIEAADLPKIFDKFFYVNRTDENLESGNGLGLSITQTIAKLHQADIDVKSQPNGGATFTVTLPLL